MGFCYSQKEHAGNRKKKTNNKQWLAVGPVSTGKMKYSNTSDAL